MDAEQIAQKARKSISRFCFEECKSYCCRKGYLILTMLEAGLIGAEKRKELEEQGILKSNEKGGYSLYLGTPEKPCPHLSDYKCTIHRKYNRPDACKKFPIFIEGKVVKLSTRCLAVKTGMMYPYIAKWISMGYAVVESDGMYDSDFYNVPLIKA